MIEPIVIKVVDKVPIVVSGPQYVVCDNSDYTVVWQLDEEWAQFESRTMQVNYKDGTYERVLFTGNTCALPALPVPGPVHVGLFAGDIHTTRPARLLAVRSATTDCGEERNPTPDGYAQAIKALDGKLDKNQGAENAGKALVVGDDGGVVPGKVQGGGSTEPGAWYVNITGTLNAPTGDKTPAEIYQAYTDGYAIYAVVQMTALYSGMPLILPLVAIVPAVGSYLVAFSASAEPHKSDAGVVSITVTWNQRWYLFASGLATEDDIPRALPNPNALTIKVGDTTTTYDGSAAKTVEVPDGNNPLGITSATVGQIAKITAVDDSGKPTAWEAVDMAGGEEVWENLTFSIPENDPVSAATINLPSANTIKACIQISLFGTLENTKFGVMVFTGSTTGTPFLSADISDFYTTAQQIRTGTIVLEKKADFWQSIFNTSAIAGTRNDTGALRLISYNSDFLYIKTYTANETFYGTIKVNYVIGGSI